MTARTTFGENFTVAVRALEAANIADDQHEGSTPPDLVTKFTCLCSRRTALLKVFDAPNVEAALATLRPKLQTVQQRLEDLSAVPVVDPTIASGDQS